MKSPTYAHLAALGATLTGPTRRSPVRSVRRVRRVRTLRTALAAAALAVLPLLALAPAARAATAATELPPFTSGFGLTLVGAPVAHSPTDFTLTVTTPQVSGPHRIRIFLPADYAADPARRWPVTYFLHGGAGSVDDAAAPADLARLAGTDVTLYTGSSLPLDAFTRVAARHVKARLDRLGIPARLDDYGNGASLAPGCDGGHDYGCWAPALADYIPRLRAEFGAADTRE